MIQKIKGHQFILCLTIQHVEYNSSLHSICTCSKKKFSLKAESYFRPFLPIYFTWLVLLFHFDTQQRWIFLHWFLSALIVLLNLVGQFAMMSLPFPQNGCLTHYPFTGKSPIVWLENKGRIMSENNVIFVYYFTLLHLTHSGFVIDKNL